MDDKTLDFVKRLAKAMAAQFGGNCEVVVHDLNTGDPERTIAAIENGHVSRRRVGDGSSPVVLSALLTVQKSARFILLQQRQVVLLSEYMTRTELNLPRVLKY